MNRTIRPAALGLRRSSIPTIFTLLLFVVSLWALESGQKVYVKRAEAPLLSDKSRDSEVLGKLTWSQEGTVKEVSGVWAKVSIGGKTGWVYSGNLTDEKPKEINKNEMLQTSSSEVSANLAARGLDSAAKAYAGRKGTTETAGQIEWLEKFNDGIKDSDIDQYLKENRLGEFSSGGAK